MRNTGVAVAAKVGHQQHIQIHDIYRADELYFDYATYGMMLFVFNAWSNPSLFQTGWFVEFLLTQTLIIHIIRTARIPFVESHASPALITTTVIICAVGIALPFTWVGSVLGFTPLPWLYWPLVVAMLLTYAVLTTL